MQENLDFFKIEHNNVLPEKGRVLVAEPFLQDHYFKRSVVLITEHNEEGTTGFVLNNLIDVPVGEIIKDFPSLNSLISIGGPVSTDTVHYIHVHGKRIPESVQISESIFWGGPIDRVKQGIEEGWISGSDIRFFVGYASWYSGQLDREISENSWLVTSIEDYDIMTGTGMEMWKQVLLNEDEKYRLWTRYPEDPMWN